MCVDLPDHKVWLDANAVPDSFPDYEVRLDVHNCRRKMCCRVNVYPFPSQIIGKLIGLAIYNKVLLDVKFPVCLYKKLLGKPVGLKDLAEVDASTAKSLTDLLAFEDEVEDVFCLTFAVGYKDLFGNEKTHNLMARGAEVNVTNANRREFVEKYVKWLLVDSIRDQFNSLARGFHVVVDSPVLELFRPEELDLVVSGTPDLNFMELEQVRLCARGGVVVAYFHACRV